MSWRKKSSASSDLSFEGFASSQSAMQNAPPNGPLIGWYIFYSPPLAHGEWPGICARILSALTTSVVFPCVVYPTFSWPFALVCLPSVSDFFSYPFSRLCLPSWDSFAFAFTVQGGCLLNDFITDFSCARRIPYHPILPFPLQG